jgi:hypothetical protein
MKRQQTQTERVGNKRGFKEKANELKSVGAPLCTRVVIVTRGGAVKIGVGKSSVVLGLRQGTASEERGVTRISPSDPKPGGKTQQEHSRNSGNGKPPKEVY